MTTETSTGEPRKKAVPSKYTKSGHCTREGTHLTSYLSSPRRSGKEVEGVQYYVQDDHNDDEDNDTNNDVCIINYLCGSRYGK